MIWKRKRALVVGPYRAHNFGDDLVGGILAKHLQSRGYRVSIPRLSKANSAWLGTLHSEDYEGEFEASDIVVVGGGGIMSDTSGPNPGASYLDLVAKAQMNGALSNTKVYITSVGAGPWILDRSKMLAFGVSLISEKVGVREPESYKHLRSLGVPAGKLVLGADLALLTPEILSFPVEPSGKLGLQFDVKSFPDLEQNTELPHILTSIREYAHRHSNDVVLLRNGRAKSELAPFSPESELLSYTSLERFLPRLAGLRAILTSHLHLAITSYSQRVPTFSLYTREKTRRFYDQIGHPERAVDLRTATAADFERLIRMAEDATWTSDDEAILQDLKTASRSLLGFID